MNRAVKIDLADACDALESLTARYDKMALTDKVDMGAKLRALLKSAEKLDKLVKADIEEARKGKEGTTLGEIFKAVLKFVPVTRLDSKLLKEKDIKTWAKYSRDDTDHRITYEPR